MNVYRRLRPLVKRDPRICWKQGWREIGGKKKYFRSRWEFNYACYLEDMKKRGEIKEWYHESDTFWFQKIKRGCVSYLPDFKVIRNNDTIYYVEVKGYMDQKSRTKINRMKLYYPETELLLIDSDWFSSNRILEGIIEGWEKH